MLFHTCTCKVLINISALPRGVEGKPLVSWLYLAYMYEMGWDETTLIPVRDSYRATGARARLLDAQAAESLWSIGRVLDKLASRWCYMRCVDGGVPRKVSSQLGAAFRRGVVQLLQCRWRSRNAVHKGYCFSWHHASHTWTIS